MLEGMTVVSVTAEKSSVVGARTPLMSSSKAVPAEFSANEIKLSASPNTKLPPDKSKNAPLSSPVGMFCVTPVRVKMFVGIGFVLFDWIDPPLIAPVTVKSLPSNVSFLLLSEFPMLNLYVAPL